jgi:hypothetical protein
MSDEPAALVPQNRITLEWADGEYEFRLPVGQLAELQTKCDAGVGKIFARLHAGRYVERSTGDVVLNPLQAEFRYEDVVEVIRLGLIGGNKGLVDGQTIEVPPTKAMQLVRDYVHTRPLLENWKVASAILSAFLIGYVDPDEVEAAEKKRAEAPAETAKGGST